MKPEQLDKVAIQSLRMYARKKFPTFKAVPDEFFNDVARDTLRAYIKQIYETAPAMAVKPSASVRSPQADTGENPPAGHEA